MSTPQKRPVKVVPIHYGKADGYEFSNGGVAFGETEKQERDRKNKRLKKDDII